MAEALFLSWAIDLLEQIENSPEKNAWCHHYSVYSSNPGQEELLRDLNTFEDRAYGEGLVISNYQEVLRRWQLEERSIADADPEWLETQPYLCVLACIAWHFRRDHFCEGSLINQSIADGIMLDYCCWHMKNVKMPEPGKNSFWQTIKQRMDAIPLQTGGDKRRP